MDFKLDEQLTMVRDMARGFANDLLIPNATKYDRQAKLDPEVYAGLGELGLWGLTIPEEFEGAGLGSTELSLVLMELNRGCASTGVTVSVHNSLVGAPIQRHGTQEQKQVWLPRLASGELIGAYCLTEANAGSDAASLKTSAKRDGDDWILNGTKMWVTNGADAGVYIVYARTDPQAPKARGISAFLVPRDTPGVSVGKKEKKVGIRASSTTEILFENARVPNANLLGQEGKAVSYTHLPSPRDS